MPEFTSVPDYSKPFVRRRFWLEATTVRKKSLETIRTIDL